MQPPPERPPTPPPPRLSFEGRRSAVRRARPGLVFLWIGLVGLLVVAALALAVVYFVNRAPDAFVAPAPSSRPDGGVPAVRAEMAGARELSGGGRVVLAGELVVSGTAPVGALGATAILAGPDGAEVGRASCASPLRAHAVGDRIPCLAPVAIPRERWRSFTFAVDARPLSPGASPAPLSVASSRWTVRSPAAGPNQVEGQLRNAGTSAARDVRVVLALYGSDGRVVGAGTAPVAGGDVSAGTAVSFSVAADALASPASFVVRAAGTR